MLLQNYQNFIEMTSYMIYIVPFGVGLKSPCKIHLNTQWEGGISPQVPPASVVPVRFSYLSKLHSAKS